MKKYLALAFMALLATGLRAQTIYPTPHSVVRGNGSVTFDEKKISEKIDRSLPAEGYVLDVTKKGVAITAADERGAFYARQTLAQIVDNGSVPVIKITDSPVVRFRGVVEGFYGKPWSHRDRLAQFVFYGQNKLNTYIYGPKDDPYHSSPNWRQPYPEAQAKQIAELASVAKANHVDFVWAIHPGGDIKWNDEDFKNLLAKFDAMYALGVRSYAVFFDDISGDGTNPHRQAELLNRINREFVKVKGDVTPLIMCPTEYNKSWANPKMDDAYLPILGRELDKDVQIMWTGDMVCADITTETLDWINARIGRPTYIWWNFPVTDYVRHLVIQGPSYGLTPQAKGRMSGFMSNPMENAEASKIALFGVADYTWNPEKYNYLAAWEEGIKRIMPQAHQAYRVFAIHSADLEKNGHGYRRDESWETNVNNKAALTKDFQDLAAVNNTILKSGADEFLVAELKPWLAQAQVVGQKGLNTIALMDVAASRDMSAIWNAYKEAEMSAQQTKDYNAHKVGTLKLMPWIVAKRDSVSASFYAALGGVANASTNPKAKLYTSVSRVSNQNVSDVANTVAIAPILEKFSVEPAAYLGIEFPMPMSIEKLTASLPGARMQRLYSLDGKTWSEKLADTDTDGVARFVIYKNNTAKAQSVRLEKMEVDVQPLANNIAALTDGDLRSAYQLSNESLVIDIPAGAVEVTVLGEKGANAIIQGEGHVSLEYFSTKIPSDLTQATINGGSGKIREIVWKIKK